MDFTLDSDGAWLSTGGERRRMEAGWVFASRLGERFLPASEWVEAERRETAITLQHKETGRAVTFGLVTFGMATIEDQGDGWLLRHKDRQTWLRKAPL